MKSRYFFIIAGVAVIIAVAFLVQHQREAGRQAGVISQKDAAGQPVESDLKVLEEYVSGHMGASVTVFLSGSYDRAVASAQAAANPGSNGEVYAKAQAACGGNVDSVTQSRCVSDYLSKNSQPSANPQPMPAPTKEAYTKTLKAPEWNVDAAGIAALLAMICASFGTYVRFSRR